LSAEGPTTVVRATAIGVRSHVAFLKSIIEGA
jgi:hypothetical protein